MSEAMTMMPRTASPIGGLSVWDESDRNLIRVVGDGFVDAGQIEEVFDATRRMIEARRARGLPVRILVDNRRIHVLSPETAARLRQGAARHRPGDRVAILVASSLARIQLRRNLDMSVHNLFLAEDEALAWLFEDSVSAT